MKLFISSSKEMMYYIAHKRHGIFCPWKSIFICKFYRNKAVRSTEHFWLLLKSVQTGDLLVVIGVR